MRRRNLRKKKTTNEQTNTAPKRSQPTGILSFSVEEEASLTVVKKPNRKRAPVASDSNVDKPSIPSTQRSAEGSYTAEKLEELKRETLTTGLPRSSPHQIKPVLKVTGSFKPTSTAPSSSEMQEAFIKVNADPHIPSQSNAEPTETGFVPPTSHIIQTAREKRERLRQAQLAPDYLPLGGATNLLNQETGRNDGRRSSGSDAEEDHMRLQFIGNIPSKREVLSEDDADMDDDEGVDSFVDAQIKKGITSLGGHDKHKLPIKQRLSSQEEEVCELPAVTRQMVCTKAEAALKKLQNTREAAHSQLGVCQTSLTAIRDDVTNSTKQIETLKLQIAEAEMRYREFQELRDYVGDLCACLQDKLSFIEELEEHVEKLYDDVRTRLDEEELIEREGRELADLASNAVLETIASEGTLELATLNADRAVQEQEAVWMTTGDDAAILSARKRTNKRREQWETAVELVSKKNVKIEDDPANNRSRFTNAIDEIRGAAETIFADVLLEFSSTEAVISRFADFKKKHPRMYNQAHVAMSISALLTPFVRIELLSWIPICGTSLGLESHKWYRSLESFGGENEDEIVPEIVKQIVLPAARLQIEKCWSPFELNSSRIVSEMLRELLVYVSIDELDMQNLLQLVQQKLADAVAVAGVQPFTSRAHKASSVIRSASEYQFRRSVHLSASISCFVELLQIEVVKSLLLSDLVCDKLLPFLRSYVHQPYSAIRKAVQLCSSIASGLFSDEISVVELMQITEVLGALTRAVEKHWAKETTCTDSEREAVELYIKLLVELGNKDLALSIRHIVL